MTKRLLILPSFLITFFTAQAQGLIHTQLTDTYTPLATGTEIYAGTAWEDPFFWELTANPEYAMPVGFNFNYAGFNLDTVFIYEEGVLAFSDSIGSEITVGGGGLTITGTPTLVLTPTYIDLVDREFADAAQNSKISYSVSGTAGSKIFKFEMDKAGIHDEYYDLSTSTNFMSYQVWLYEGSNVIEYRYGPSNITDPAYVANNAIAVAQSGVFMDTIMYGLKVTGAAGTEDTVYMHNSNVSSNMTGYTGIPTDGTVHRFAPGNLGMKEIKTLTDANVFPNPFVMGMTLKISGKTQFNTYRIIGMDGVEVASGKLNNNQFLTTGLASGSYLLELQNGSTKAVEKIIVN